MTTKLWIRTFEERPAILVEVRGPKVNFRVDDKLKVMSKARWERLPLWTGLSPYLQPDEAKEMVSLVDTSG